MLVKGHLRRVWGLVLAVVLIGAAALPAAAQDDPPVSSVNDTPITRSAFEGRVRFVRWQYLQELEKLHELTGGNLALSPSYVMTLVFDLEHPADLAGAVLDQMEEEILLEQQAAALNIAITPEEVTQRETAFFSLWTDVPANKLAADPLAQAFIAEWYAEAIESSGLDQTAIREIFAAETLRSALYAYLAANVPAEELAVNTRHILCSFDPDAPGSPTAPTGEQRATARACIDDATARLAAGEPFADIARDLSADGASAAQGGSVGWVTLSYLATPYANAARDAELNTVIGPVETEYGLHLIEVLDRRMQTLSAEEYQASQQGYFRLWIDTLRAQATIERSDGWDAVVPDQPALDSLDPAVRSAIENLAPQAE
jgi:hypothetical protein